jgi:hypothetical protein
MDSRLCNKVLKDLSLEFKSEKTLYFDSCNSWYPIDIYDNNTDITIFKISTIPEDIEKIVISEIIESKSRYIFFDTFLQSIVDVSKQMSIIRHCLENNCTIFSIFHLKKLEKIPLSIYDEYKIRHDILSINNVSEIIIYIECSDGIQNHKEWVRNFYTNLIDDKINNILN